MSKLTDEARAYCQEALEVRGRYKLVEMLESIGIACYDEEDVEELAEAVVDSVEAGDIDFEWDHVTAKNLHAYAYMLWLDIDEIWEHD